MASKNKTKSKIKKKHTNYQKSTKVLNTKESRSSSSCSSGFLSTHSSSSLTNQLNDKLNLSQSTSHSNDDLSDLSSGFSSSFDSNFNSISNSVPAKLSSEKFKSTLDKSRSYSPSSSTTSSSLSHPFLFNTSDQSVNNHESVKKVLNEINLNNSQKSDKSAKKNLKRERFNAIKNSKIKSEIDSNDCTSREINCQSKCKLSNLNPFIYLGRWLFNYSDYIIILTISILINLNTLDAGFVYDDNRAIKTNPDVEWSNPLINLFKNDFWGTPIDQNNSHKSYRPLCVLTFKINHLLHQFDARGYHLVNLIFHCLVCLIYTSLVKRWTYRESNDWNFISSKETNNSEKNHSHKVNLDEMSTDAFNLVNLKAVCLKEIGSREQRLSTKLNIFDRFSNYSTLKQLSAFNLLKQLSNLNLPPIYLISSLLFCLHPIHTEAVAGLVGRADIGCALLFLLSLYFYDNYLNALYRSISSDFCSCESSNFCSSSSLNLHLNSRSKKIFSTTANSNSQFNEVNKGREKKDYKDTTSKHSNNPTSNWSISLHSSIQFYFSILFGGLSVLFKEYGLTVFIVCAFYHLITHCNYLVSINQSNKRLANSNSRNLENLNSTKRRWQTYKLTATKQDKLGDSFKSKEQSNGQCEEQIFEKFNNKSKFFLFIRSSLAILTNDTFSRVRKAWLYLLLAFVTISSLRIWIMGDLPQFSSSDNPTAVNRCALTRTLTFLYLIAFNFWLLIYPNQLSFDWSMESIPLVKFNDLRNLSTLAFFIGLIGFVIKLINYYVIEIDFYLNTSFDHEQINQLDDDQFSSCSERNYESSHSDESFDSFKSSSTKSTDYETNFYRQNSSESKACKANIFKSGPFFRSTKENNSHDLNSKQNHDVYGFFFNQKNLKTKNFRRINFTQIDICLLAITLLVLPFLPATNLFTYVGFVVAERCLYIPSMGFCLLISVAFVHFKQQLIKLTSISSTKKSKKSEKVSSSSLNFILEQQRLNHLNKSTHSDYLDSKANHFNEHFKNDLKISSKDDLESSWQNNPPKNRSKNKHSQLFKQSKKRNKLIDSFLINLNQYTNLIFNLLLFALMVSFAYRTYLRNFDWTNEETLYRSGINVNPPKSLGNLASILSQNGFKEEAELTYRKALRYRHNMADVHYNLGILLQEQKRYDESLECYRNAIKYRPRLASAYLNMGYVYSLIKQNDKAIEMYKLCATIDGEGLKDFRTHQQSIISALYNLGKLYADQGDYELALLVYKQAIKKDPNQTYYQLHSLYSLIAEAYSNMGLLEEAEEYYLKAFKFKQDHLPLYLSYAKFLNKLNRYDEAYQWFTNARLLAPNDTSTLLHFGQFLCDQKKYEQAADIYRDAIKNGMPSSFELIYNYANVLRMTKRSAEAENFYKLAVELRPNDISAHLNLGAMLHLNGKLHEAKQHYLVVLKLSPNNTIAKINLDKLRSIEKY